jgi:hypothetical protein
MANLRVILPGQQQPTPQQQQQAFRELVQAAVAQAFAEQLRPQPATLLDGKVVVLPRGVR